MKRVIISSTEPLLRRLRNSGFTMKEIRKMLKQETGLDITDDTRSEFKQWCEEFLSEGQGDMR